MPFDAFLETAWDDHGDRRLPGLVDSEGTQTVYAELRKGDEVLPV